MTATHRFVSAISLLVLAGQTPFTDAFVPPPSQLAVSPSSVSTTANARSSPLSAVKEATFGMGCFWEPAEALLKQPGVLATTVGYTGAPPSKKQAPTYDSVCFGKDWVEAVRVAYDDELVSYNQLLDSFFELQNPRYSRQYASIVFANDKTEEKEAMQWKKTCDLKRDDLFPLEMVEIEPSSRFFKAEEYHQRYWEKQRLRFLIGFLLIAGESGAYDNFLDGALGKVELFGLSSDSICGAVFLIGAAWMLLERLVVNDVRELKGGDLTAMALEGK